MANIRDVAKRANVSIATVSRLINGDAACKLKASTKEAVFAAIKELNYSPKPSYTKSGKRNINVGCVMNMTTEKQLDSFYVNVLSGFEKGLNSRNYRLSFIKSQYEIENTDTINQLLREKPKGVLLMSQPRKAIFDLLKENNIIMVGVDTGLLEIDNVIYNRFDAGCVAMDYLISNGHRKIAFIGSQRLSNPEYEAPKMLGRYNAYIYSMQVNGLPINESWVKKNCNWSKEICFQNTLEILKSDERPTAIFVSSDYMAIACLSALYQSGVKVPDDISIISISDIPEARYLNPPLTTITVPQAEMGKLAVSALVRRIEGDDSVCHTINVPVSLCIRDSVRRI